ncbi:MAG: hypothetical protein EBV03_06625 [Proteobacteria bacterium]|nr:hypothetical protein [Pseudomonadota bacterium]
MDKQQHAIEALRMLWRRQANRTGPSPQLEFEGKPLTLARWEDEGKPGTVAMSGAGENKRVFDLMDGRALALPNYEQGTPDQPHQDDMVKWVESWRKSIGDEARNAAMLKALGFETVGGELREVKVEGHALPVLVMPSFSGLAAKNMQVKDTKNKHSSGGSSMLFASTQNLTNPDYIREMMTPLMDDCARLSAYGMHLSTDSFNLMIRDTERTVPHDRSQPGSVVERGQEARLLLLDVGHDIAMKGPPKDLRARVERNVERLFEAALNSVGDAELNLLEKTGSDYYRWDAPAQEAFEKVKPQLVEMALAKAEALAPDALARIAQARREADEPPRQLPGGGSPELLTGQGKEQHRGPA